MIEIKIKVGRDEMWINENDLILDNGSCYQIITRQKFSGWTSAPVKMSKHLFNEFKKCHLIYTNNELDDLINKHYANRGSNIGLVYWKFDIDAMKRIGYEFRESLKGDVK